jgi:site-specific DNA-methyltransferase (adenine-specific)
MEDYKKYENTHDNCTGDCDIKKKHWESGNYDGVFCSSCFGIFEYDKIGEPKKIKKAKGKSSDKNNKKIDFKEIDLSTLEDIEVNKIYNEDCLITMKRMPDNCVDHVITSPPYNIGKGAYKKYKELDDSMSDDEYLEWSKEVINECLRVSKHYVFWNIQMLSGNKVALWKTIGYFSEYLKEVAIWNKNISAPAYGEGVMNSKYEFVLIFSKKDPELRQFKDAQFKQGKLTNVWEIKRARNIHAAVHKAVFPLDLPRFIIKNFAKKKQTIYEPFTGTGTTPAACVLEGLNYIGSELSKEYFDIIEEKINEHTLMTDQQSMF